MSSFQRRATHRSTWSKFQRLLEHIYGFPEDAIDGHIHMFGTAAENRGLPGAPPFLQREFTADELRETLTTNGFGGGGIFVQDCDAPNHMKQNRRVATLAESNPWILGIVAGANMRAGAAVAEELAEIKSLSDRVVGIRVVYTQDQGPDDAALLDRNFLAACNEVAKAGLVLDFLARERNPGQMEQVGLFAKRVPTSLVVVANHCLKPAGMDSLEEPSDAWKTAIDRLAARDNTFMKISGLMSEIPPGTEPERVFPWLEYVLDQFGSERLIFGSDYPVSGLVGSHLDALAYVLNWISVRGGDQTFIADVFRDNAERAYSLN